MHTIIITDKKMSILIDDYIHLFSFYKNKNAISIFNWDETGDGIENSVPGLYEEIRGHEEWRAIILCNEKNTAFPNNPFRFSESQDTEKKTSLMYLSEKLYETHHASEVLLYLMINKSDKKAKVQDPVGNLYSYGCKFLYYTLNSDSYKSFSADTYLEKADIWLYFLSTLTIALSDIQPANLHRTRVYDAYITTNRNKEKLQSVYQKYISKLITIDNQIKIFLANEESQQTQKGKERNLIEYSEMTEELDMDLEEKIEKTAKLTRDETNTFLNEHEHSEWSTTQTKKVNETIQTLANELIYSRIGLEADQTLLEAEQEIVLEGKESEYDRNEVDYSLGLLIKGSTIAFSLCFFTYLFTFLFMRGSLFQLIFATSIGVFSVGFLIYISNFHKKNILNSLESSIKTIVFKKPKRVKYEEGTLSFNKYFSKVRNYMYHKAIIKNLEQRHEKNRDKKKSFIINQHFLKEEIDRTRKLHAALNIRLREEINPLDNLEKIDDFIKKSLKDDFYTFSKDDIGEKIPLDQTGQECNAPYSFIESIHLKY
ncbi:MAG: hypothetical protein FWG98_03370 [Candidatus Cloacimonetes bacterium]|nr:hypothetical protein [Candidatus Cloacimonadota bacterium]